VLTYMQKGVTAQQQINGGRKVVESGISLCEYVMPGLGGKKMSHEHVMETAKVLNEINPDYIRLRSLHVHPIMALWAKIQDGDFELQTEDEVVEEIGTLIENLRVTSYLKSDHILNLLMEVEGKLPEGKQKCLTIINEYLSLPDAEKLNFKFGRRLGYYGRLSDLKDSYMHHKIDEVITQSKRRGENMDEVLFKLKDSFI